MPPARTQEADLAARAPPASLSALLFDSLRRSLDYDRRAGASRAGDRALRCVREALRQDDLACALREIDRAWRTNPEDAAVLAPIYARLLCVEDRHPDAVLGLLDRIETPDPELAALRVYALLRIQAFAAAQTALEDALRSFCVAPGDLLSAVAGSLLSAPGAPVGWIGRGSALELIGELAAQAPLASLRIEGPRTGLIARPLAIGVRDGRPGFGFRLPPVGIDAPLTVSLRGLPLLGSGARLRGDFGLDGRAQAAGRAVFGWVRLGWAPAAPPRLFIEDGAGRGRALRPRAIPRAGFAWPFRFEPRKLGLRFDALTISAELPDGRRQPLPDAPLLSESAARRGTRAGKRAPRRRRPRAAATDVIVPVYGGREETLACIDSVLATLDARSRLLVVDDATEEAPLAAALDALAAAGRITLLRNPHNLGFVASVNRALGEHPTRDAVLLNADTLVFDDWLARLRAAAYSAPRAGTATPLSNSGSITSYPRDRPVSIDAEEARRLHGLAAAVQPGLRVEIPVGVGFCLYLRRDCLDAVGEFDAAVFGKGYGEESDFCMRARALGWSHRLAADVFVYHAGGRSFGARRAALLDRSQRLLNLRHPGYDRRIAAFLKRDPLQSVRRRLDERRLQALEAPVTLIVTLALQGGVERFVEERGRDLAAQGKIPLLLRPSRAGDAGEVELSTTAIDAPNLRYRIPAQLPALGALLRSLRLESVQIQHFIHLDARVLELVRALGAPYDIVVHDFAWVCPRVTLIDASRRYCGEPAINVCEVCVKRSGSQLGEAISVARLRRRSAAWLAGARRVSAPSADTAARLQRHFPGIAFTVRAHPQTAEPVSSAPPPPPRRRRDSKPAAERLARVALIGAIGTHKGYRVLLHCARDAKARRLPLEFVVIGYTENDAPLLKTGKVFITGRYSEGEAPHLLRRERPDLTFLPAVWPETWSYTLDHALGAGVPVIAFDLGAIAERLRRFGRGTLLPLAMPPARINDRLLQLAAAPDAAPELEPAPAPEPAPGERRAFAANATLKMLPLAPGLYGLSAGDGVAMPGIHIGVGPGVRPESVQFAPAQPQAGTWLRGPQDYLLVKISGTGVSLVASAMGSWKDGGARLNVENLSAQT